MKLIIFLTVLLLLGIANGKPGAKLSRTKPQSHIVGGIQVAIQDYPYQLSLQYYGSHICGASIIHTSWSLTAAHCVYDAIASTLSVKAGSANNTGVKTYYISKIIVHAEYLKPDNDVDYDIALLKVKTPFNYTTNIKNIALPALNLVVPGKTNSTVSGWGAISEGGNSPVMLRAVSVPIVTQSECNKTLEGDITSRMICAGLTEGGKDSCQGDSGGPLVAMIGGVKQLIGIVSWGYGCAQANAPGVYTNVAYFRNWIKNSTANVV